MYIKIYRKKQTYYNHQLCRTSRSYKHLDIQAIYNMYTFINKTIITIIQTYMATYTYYK